MAIEGSWTQVPGYQPQVKICSHFSPKSDGVEVDYPGDGSRPFFGALSLILFRFEYLFLTTPIFTSRGAYPAFAQGIHSLSFSTEFATFRLPNALL